MNKETTELINKLAEKLGTTSEYLWQILINQAPIQSTIDLIMISIVILFGFFLYGIHKNLCVIKDYYGHKETGYDYYAELAIVPMVFGLVTFCVLFFASFFAIPSVLNGFFNPEYWALNEVLKYLK